MRVRRGVTVAFVVTLVGAATIMVSPITPWASEMAVVGLVLVVPGAAVLIWWLISGS